MGNFFSGQGRGDYGAKSRLTLQTPASLLIYKWSEGFYFRHTRTLGLLECISCCYGSSRVEVNFRWEDCYCIIETAMLLLPTTIIQTICTLSFHKYYNRTVSSTPSKATSVDIIMAWASHNTDATVMKQLKQAVYHRHCFIYYSHCLYCQKQFTLVLKQHFLSERKCDLTTQTEMYVKNMIFTFWNAVMFMRNKLVAIRY